MFLVKMGFHVVWIEWVMVCVSEVSYNVLVNGKIVNIPSYLLNVGDVIEIKENKKDSQRYKDVLELTGGRAVPAWLTQDQENLKGEVNALPLRSEIDVPVDEMLIVELYSK